MDVNDEIAKEIDKERQERETQMNKPVRVSQTQVNEARYFWMIGVGLVDILTAWLILSMTQYWYYSLLWVAAGAGGLLWSERQKGRIGNNDEQTKIANTGVVVSAGAVVIMALAVGTYWVLGSRPLWLYPAIEASALILFFFHLYQAYRYHNVDDEIVARNEEARLEEANARRIKEAHRAARIVDARKKERGVKEIYRREHGGAFDAALGQSYPQEVRTPVQDRTSVPLGNQKSSVKNENPAQTRPEVRYHLKDLLEASGKTVDELAKMEQKAFGIFVSGSFDEINSYNINVLWSEVRKAYKMANPTQAGSRSQ